MESKEVGFCVLVEKPHWWEEKVFYNLRKGGYSKEVSIEKEDGMFHESGNSADIGQYCAPADSIVSAFAGSKCAAAVVQYYQLSGGDPLHWR